MKLFAALPLLFAALLAAGSTTTSSDGGGGGADDGEAAERVAAGEARWLTDLAEARRRAAEEGAPVLVAFRCEA